MEQDIVERIRARMPDAEVDVTVEGNRALITVVSEAFASLSRVARQQAVYACIDELIADGRLHAVTIRAQPPGE